MGEKTAKKNQKSKLRLRTVLMFLQILLPFGLYAALQMDGSLAAGVIAGAFLLSMGMMVWLG